MACLEGSVPPCYNVAFHYLFFNCHHYTNCNQPGRPSFQVDYSNNQHVIDDDEELLKEDNSDLKEDALGDEEDELQMN